MQSVNCNVMSIKYKIAGRTKVTEGPDVACRPGGANSCCRGTHDYKMLLFWNNLRMYIGVS